MNQAFDVGEIVQKDGDIWVRGRALQDIFIGEHLYSEKNSSQTSKYLIKQIKTYGKYIDGLYAPMTGDLLVEIEGELKAGEHMLYR